MCGHPSAAEQRPPQKVSINRDSRFMIFIYIMLISRN